MGSVISMSYIHLNTSTKTGLEAWVDAELILCCDGRTPWLPTPRPPWVHLRSCRGHAVCVSFTHTYYGLQLQYSQSKVGYLKTILKIGTIWINTKFYNVHDIHKTK